MLASSALRSPHLHDPSGRRRAVARTGAELVLFDLVRAHDITRVADQLRRTRPQDRVVVLRIV